MARTTTQHQGTIPRLRGLLDVLGPVDQAAFKEILGAATLPTGTGNPTFFGAPYFVSEFDLLQGTTLRWHETPIPLIAQELATLGDADTFSARGTMTQDHVIICFGLADWAGRLLVITKTSFDRFLAAEWPDALVPSAERRMLLQLLIGQSPQQAAKTDKMGYETKRTYVKQLCRRLNVSGQVELISAVLGRLLIAINARASDAGPDQASDPIQTYKQDHLPAASRVLQLLDGKGKKITILDIGPQTGRPVLVAHSMILPFFSDGMVARLQKTNLRLLVPLRPGIFDPQAKVPTSVEYTERTLEGLALCKSLLAGQDAPVLGLSTGGPWAVKFAKRYPELVPKLFLVSMTFGAAKNDTLLSRFFGSFSSMVVERPALLSVYVDFLLNRHKDPTRFRKMNDKVFPPGTLDGDTMTWEFAQSGALEAYMHYYHTSPAFLKSDAHTDYEGATHDIAHLPCTVHLLHGTHNERDSIETLRALAAGAPNARLSELNGAGYVLRGADLDAVWDIVADSN